MVRYISVFYVFLLICALFNTAAGQEVGDCGVRVLPSVESPSSYHNYPVSSQFQLDMVRGESEHVQLVLKCTPGDRYSFGSHSTSADLHSSFRELKQVNGYYDALVPIGESLICTDSLVSVWVTFTCGYNASPGTHRQIIEIRGKQNFIIDFTLFIHGVDIPQYSSIPIVAGVESRCMTDGLVGRDADREKERWIDFMLEYRLTPAFGTRVSEDRWLYEHSFSPWGWNDRRTWKLLDDERYSCFVLPHLTLSGEELDLMQGKIRRKGELSKCLFYIWDEPVCMADYKQIMERVGTIRSIVPEARILATFFCGPRDGDRKGDLYAVYDYLDGTIDIASTSLASCGGKEEEVQAVRKHAPESMAWWSYVCWKPDGKEPNFLLSMDGIQQRAIMWRTWKNKSEGVLYWNSNIYHQRKPFTYITDMPHGDGILIYPGDVFGVQGPVASARLERWHDGAEEMELLRLLEKQKGRAHAERVLKRVYHSPLQYIELADNIPLFRKELISEIESHK